MEGETQESNEGPALEIICTGIIDRLGHIKKRAKKASCPKELLNEIDEARGAIAMNNERIKNAQKELECGADTIVEFSEMLGKMNEKNVENFKNIIESKLGNFDDMKLFEGELDLNKNIGYADTIVQQQNLAIKLLRKREESCINALHKVSMFFETGLSTKLESNEACDRRHIIDDLKSLANKINDLKANLNALDNSKTLKLDNLEPIANRLYVIDNYFNNKNQIVSFKMPDDDTTSSIDDNKDDGEDDSSSNNDKEYLQLLLTKGIATDLPRNDDKNGNCSVANSSLSSPSIVSKENVSSKKTDESSNDFAYPKKNNNELINIPKDDHRDDSKNVEPAKNKFFHTNTGRNEGRELKAGINSTSDSPNSLTMSNLFSEAEMQSSLKISLDEQNKDDVNSDNPEKDGIVSASMIEVSLKKIDDERYEISQKKNFNGDYQRYDGTNKGGVKGSAGGEDGQANGEDGSAGGADGRASGTDECVSVEFQNTTSHNDNSNNQDISSNVEGLSHSKLNKGDVSVGSMHNNVMVYTPEVTRGQTNDTRERRKIDDSVNTDAETDTSSTSSPIEKNNSGSISTDRDDEHHKSMVELNRGELVQRGENKLDEDSTCNTKTSPSPTTKANAHAPTEIASSSNNSSSYKGLEKTSRNDKNTLLKDGHVATSKYGFQDINSNVPLAETNTQYESNKPDGNHNLGEKHNPDGNHNLVDNHDPDGNHNPGENHDPDGNHNLGENHDPGECDGPNENGAHPTKSHLGNDNVSSSTSNSHKHDNNVSIALESLSPSKYHNYNKLSLPSQPIPIDFNCYNKSPPPSSEIPLSTTSPQFSDLNSSKKSSTPSLSNLHSSAASTISPNLSGTHTPIFTKSLPLSCHHSSTTSNSSNLASSSDSKHEHSVKAPINQSSSTETLSHGHTNKPSTLDYNARPNNCSTINVEEDSPFFFTSIQKYDVMQRPVVAETPSTINRDEDSPYNHIKYLDIAQSGPVSTKPIPVEDARTEPIDESPNNGNGSLKRDNSNDPENITSKVTPNSTNISPGINPDSKNCKLLLPKYNLGHNGNVNDQKPNSSQTQEYDDRAVENLMFIEDNFKTESSREYYSAKSNKSVYEQSLKSNKSAYEQSIGDSDKKKLHSTNDGYALNRSINTIETKDEDPKKLATSQSNDNEPESEHFNSKEKHKDVDYNNSTQSKSHSQDNAQNDYSHDQFVFAKDKDLLLKRFVDTNFSKEYPGLFTGLENPKVPSLEPPEVLDLLNIYRAQVAAAVLERDKFSDMANELRIKVETLEKSNKEFLDRKLSTESAKQQDNSLKSTKTLSEYQKADGSQTVIPVPKKISSPPKSISFNTSSIAQTPGSKSLTRNVDPPFENPSLYKTSHDAQQIRHLNSSRYTADYQNPAENAPSFALVPSIDEDCSEKNRDIYCKDSIEHSPDSEPLISQLINKDINMIKKKSSFSTNKVSSFRTSIILESLLNKTRDLANSTDSNNFVDINSNEDGDIMSKFKSQKEFKVFFKILNNQFEQLDQRIVEQAEVLKLKDEEIDFFKKSLGPDQENIYAHKKALELQVESLLKRLVDVEYELTKSKSEIKESREALEILENCLLIEREKTSHINSKLEEIVNKEYQNIMFDVKYPHLRNDANDNKSTMVTMKFNNDEISDYNRMLDFAKNPNKYLVNPLSDTSSTASYPKVETSAPKLIIDRDVRGIRRKKPRKEVHSGLRKQSLGWKEFSKKEFNKFNISNELESYFSYGTINSADKLRNLSNIREKFLKKSSSGSGDNNDQKKLHTTPE